VANSSWATMALPGTSVNNPLPGAAAYITYLGTLNTVAQGAASSEREGRKVVIKGLELRHLFTLSSSAVAANTSTSVRLITVLDKQCNGATPSETDLFNVATNKTNNMYNLDNAQRFSILSYETMDNNAQASVGAG